MSRVVLVLALVSVLAGCASSAPQPSAASSPSAAVPSSTIIPRYTARGHCVESHGVWRATASVCEYEAE
jgi:hypothetical protein